MDREKTMPLEKALTNEKKKNESENERKNKVKGTPEQGWSWSLLRPEQQFCTEGMACHCKTGSTSFLLKCN